MINVGRQTSPSPVAKSEGSPHIRQGFRFGRFALDVRARELHKDGVRIRLQDQPFGVLVMLLEQPGEVLTRDEMRRQLWPDGTFVDFEHGLNAAVKRLRATIGDKADNPRFIETLHRRGYRFIAAVERIEPDPEPQTATGPAFRFGSRPGLAVMPFKDLGNPEEDPYFSEGLTEEMITQLGRFFANRMAVAARTSSMLVRRNARTLRSIGQVLRVDYVLEGSVRRESRRVRVTAQLIETLGESQVWAETYERDLTDCLLVQADIASRIARALSLELLPDARQQKASGTHDPLAYQAYLKGRFHGNNATGSGLTQAISYFEEAIALDPAFAAAHASLGRAHIATARAYLVAPRPAIEAGRRAAVRALELDDTDANAHLTLAEVRKFADWDWTQAEDSYRLAVSCNPSHESACRLYAQFLAERSRPAEAALLAERACELDPLCITVNTGAAWVRYLEGDYDAAIKRCRHTLDMEAACPPASRVLAASLFQMGRIDEAIAQLEAVTGGQADPVSIAWLAHMLGASGNGSRARGFVQRLESLAADRYISPYHTAIAHAGLGSADDTFAALEKAYDDRDPALVSLRVEPRFAGLRADARYGTLISRLGLV
jgi:TolB-like protein/Tfp pilus assembly protein PilF